MHKNSGSLYFRILNTALLLMVVFATLYPFVFILSVSLSSSSAVILKQVKFLPVGLNFRAYEKILAHPTFWEGYRNTILYTVLGTVIALSMTILAAYSLSKKRMGLRKIFMGMVVFTMFFNGGLIPQFLLVRSLGLIDTVWAIVIPGAISTWNMIIMKTYFDSLPDSLEEAAEIDGMNPIQVLGEIVVPLSMPIIATITLFYAVFFWNDWFRPLIFLNSNDKYPITLFLRNIVMGAQLAAQTGELEETDAKTIAENLSSAAIILVTTPILCVYPFIQKYFVKGIMIGSLKG